MDGLGVLYQVSAALVVEIKWVFLTETKPYWGSLIRQKQKQQSMFSQSFLSLKYIKASHTR